MSFAARQFWGRLAAVLAADRCALLAVVAESSVHSPGTAGAKMFVAEDGERFGTIGGGIMELRVLERAGELLGSEPLTGSGWAQRAEMIHRRSVGDEITDRSAERSGMICAGRQANLYALLRPKTDLETVQEIASRLDRGEGEWRLDSAGRLRVADESGRSRTLESTDEWWIFTEPLLERRRLAILGGGHCGQALARLMAGLGWVVSVWETRAGVIEGIGLDGVADVHLVDDFRLAAPAIDLPRLTPVVVMTTDVPNDTRALFGALSDDRGLPFVGAMGSTAKLAEVRRRLAELGMSDGMMSKMTAPVGLEIDSHTPPEIAVSVAAQLLRLRHRWLG